MNGIERREFITLLGGAAAAWPLAARAQQSAMPVIGFLSSASPDGMYAPVAAALQRGLNETGYVDSQNVAIEYRWARGRYERLPSLATELVRRPVNVLVASGGTVSVLAAKQTTTTIPIVFIISGDPVLAGIVGSLNHPGGNITGVSFLGVELGRKRVELLREIVPKAAAIAFLVNPNNPSTQVVLRDVQAATHAFDLSLYVLTASTEREIDAAFATHNQTRIDALVIAPDGLFGSQRDQIIALAKRHSMPAIYVQRDFVAAGGLISYGTSLTDAHRQAGVYTGRILKGAKPADLPVLQPTKFELAINLKTAKALGIDVPTSVLATADEVIE